MKRRQRVRTLGCGGLLIVCVAVALYAWYVEMPKLSDAMETTLRDGFATLVAEEVRGRYAPADLQSGEEVRFSFTYLNQHMLRTGQDESAQVEIFSSSDTLGLRGVASRDASSFETVSIFVPEVTTDGRLSLNPASESAWLDEWFMGPLGGALEAEINDWLQLNQLVLTDVKLTPNALILSVIGE